MGEQVDGGVLVVLQVELRVVRFKGASAGEVGLFGFMPHNDGYIVGILFFLSLEKAQRVVAELYGSRRIGSLIGEWRKLFLIADHLGIPD